MVRQSTVTVVNIDQDYHDSEYYHDYWSALSHIAIVCWVLTVFYCAKIVS